jgi:hypothetical protein
MILNKACDNHRKVVPLSSYENAFVTLSELDLVKVFWKDDSLRTILQRWATNSIHREQQRVPVQSEVITWLSGTKPGHLIVKMLTDIGGYSPGERKKYKGYKATTFKMSINDMRRHIQAIRDATFHPKSYKERGYALRGSIRTDGFLLQILAFKLNELNSVKYKRLPAEKLPLRIASTQGGTDDSLTEIRNVVRTKEDIIELWDCDPGKIKILGLDPGQACVVGASALLPNREGAETGNKKPKFVNLSVKQKAVYQPTLKQRHWMERRKARTMCGPHSISEIESALPPLRGEGASITKYIEKLQDVDVHLSSFYNSSNVIKKHRWNARRARDEEYKRMANSLLKMVGGSIGAKRDENNKVVIAVGLGKFASNSRLSSLHESFQSYFVKRVSVQCIEATLFVFGVELMLTLLLLALGEVSGLHCRWCERVLYFEEVPDLRELRWPGGTPPALLYQVHDIPSQGCNGWA